MVNQQLLDYIKQQLQQGVSRDNITNNLISQGWQQSDVNEGFSSIENFSSSQVSSPNHFLHCHNSRRERLIKQSL